MAKRRLKNESIDNLQRVVDAEAPAVVGQMDVVMADAVQESAKNDEHAEEVATQLQKTADVVIPEDPKEEKPAVDNKFTAKLVLDESLEDFSLVTEDATPKDGRARKVYDDDDEDEYLDYDMFDFVYGLVTDCWPKPLNPLGHKMRKFMYIGSDKYMDSPDADTRDSSDGHAQVASYGDSIEVYSNNPADFKDIEDVCKLYKLSYSGPHRRRSKSTYWEYSFRVNVPCVSSGYPYMVEEYFETLGMTMEDVMPADFCKQYRKRQATVEKEAKKYINQAEVDKLIDKAITAAAQDNTEPLEAHLKRLYVDLDAAGLTYQKSKVKKTFMDAFDDPEEDDE